MNLIPEIAKVLGVEIGEKFKVTRYANVVFRFDETSLQFYSNLTNEWRETSDELYKMIMKGDTEVKRLPFEPKDGEKYWTVYWKGIVDMPCAVYETWRGDSCDFANKVSGNCFRTEAEAEAHKFEIFEKLTGKKWAE